MISFIKTKDLRTLEKCAFKGAVSELKIKMYECELEKAKEEIRELEKRLEKENANG
jgi:hypothetical protein